MDPEGPANEYVIPTQARPPSTLPEPRATASGNKYDLPALIDIALSNNPDTRQTWDQARAAADAYGVSRAPYYPVISAQVPGAYSQNIRVARARRRPQAMASNPVIELTYTLLDFGRRDAGAAAARDQLAAANFSFNRKLQDVVFATQRSFYSIGAAKAAVQAAEQNLELAKTDDEAVSRRVDLGLATQPELLLSRQRVAQSQYDLASAHLLVREAQANMAVALGVAANTALDVPSLESLPIPAGFGSEVDQLIETAVRQRPDLAAQVATLDARRADVAGPKRPSIQPWESRAAMANRVGATESTAPQRSMTPSPNMPALLSVNWDLFTGFKRLNDVRPGRGRARRRRRATQVARGRCDKLRLARVLRIPDRAQPLRLRQGPARRVARVVCRQSRHLSAGTQHHRRVTNRRSRSRQRPLHDRPEPRGPADLVSRRRVRRGSHRDAPSVTRS